MNQTTYIKPKIFCVCFLELLLALNVYFLTFDALSRDEKRNFPYEKRLCSSVSLPLLSVNFLQSACFSLTESTSD